MARFQKGRKKTGGRKAGVRNKTTQRRIDAAERAILLAKAGGKRLAREVLEDFLELFSAIALTHQPALPGAERNPNCDEKKFEKFARLAVEISPVIKRRSSRRCLWAPISASGRATVQSDSAMRSWHAGSRSAGCRYRFLVWMRR